MRYDIGNFVEFSRVVKGKIYGAGRILHVVKLQEPFPVGQVTGFKYLLMGDRDYDSDYGYAFFATGSLGCYEIRIGIMNKPFYVREQDILSKTGYLNFPPKNIRTYESFKMLLKMKVYPDDIVKYKTKPFENKVNFEKGKTIYVEE